MALWQLFLLFVFTSGLYAIFWTLRVAKDMRRHLDSSVRPYLFAVGSIIPVVNLFVVYHGNVPINVEVGGQALPTLSR